MGDLRKKKGQVTIFIIIGLIIVAAALLIFAFKPKINTTTGLDVKNPNLFIQQCVEEDLKDLVETISLQGGSVDPVFYYEYDNEKLQYLCYTDKIFEPCYRQKSNLRKAVEEEIDQFMEGKVKECFISLKKGYQDKSYSATLVEGDVDTELISGKINFDFNYKLSLDKGGSLEVYDDFKMVLNSNLFELLRITKSIIDWELVSPTGAPIFEYASLYPDLTLEKHIQEGGTKVYIISDDKTEEKFQFASRSQLTSDAQT